MVDWRSGEQRLIDLPAGDAAGFLNNRDSICGLPKSKLGFFLETVVMLLLTLCTLGRAGVFQTSGSFFNTLSLLVLAPYLGVAFLAIPKEFNSLRWTGLNRENSLSLISVA